MVVRPTPSSTQVRNAKTSARSISSNAGPGSAFDEDVEAFVVLEVSTRPLPIDGLF